MNKSNMLSEYFGILTHTPNGYLRSSKEMLQDSIDIWNCFNPYERYNLLQNILLIVRKEYNE